MTSSAGDLSDAFKEQLAGFDNGDWSLPQWQHYCVSGVCRICKGDARESKKHMKELVRSSLVRGCPVALLYRWKYFEDAQGFALRCSRQHQLLSRALGRMFKDRDVQRAEAALEREDADADSSLKRTARGGKAKSFFQQESTVVFLETSTIVCGPIQEYLNLAFKAEKVVNEAISILTVPVAFVDEARRREVSEDAFARNARLLEGSYGSDVLLRYTRMLTSFDDPLWHDLGRRVSRASLFEAAVAMLQAAAAAWRRLVLPGLSPRARLIGACHDCHWKPRFVEAELANIHRELSALGGTCQNCLDQHWTGALLPSLMVRPAAAHAFIVDQVTVCRVSSSIAERPAHRGGMSLAVLVRTQKRYWSGGAGQGANV